MKTTIKTMKKLSILMLLFLMVATLNSCNKLDKKENLNFEMNSESSNAFDKTVLESDGSYLNKQMDQLTKEELELFYLDMGKMDKFIVLKDGQYKLLSNDFKKIGISSNAFEYFRNMMLSTNKDMESLDIIPINDKQYTVKSIK